MNVLILQFVLYTCSTLAPCTLASGHLRRTAAPESVVISSLRRTLAKDTFQLLLDEAENATSSHRASLLDAKAHVWQSPAANNLPVLLESGLDKNASGALQDLSLSSLNRESISNETVQGILTSIANSEGQVILLVFKMDEALTALEFVLNWVYFLKKISPGLLEHTLMIVPDTNSYDLCRAEGLPVYLDGAFPFQYWNSTPWYHEVDHGINRHFTVMKHWWGLKIIELGYSVLFSDTDIVLLQDPLAYLAKEPSPSYDLQVQSDSGGPEDSPAGFMLSHPCGIYKVVKEERAPGGAQMREIWGFKDNDSETQLQIQNPCANSGFWYMRPSPAAIAFAEMLVDRLLFSLPWGWDQVAMNEVIMGFVVGVGGQPPLRVRLFPLADVGNLGAWENRRLAGLPAKPIMVHAAGINGAEDKSAALAKHGLWNPGGSHMIMIRNHVAAMTASIKLTAAAGSTTYRLATLVLACGTAAFMSCWVIFHVKQKRSIANCHV